MTQTITEGGKAEQTWIREGQVESNANPGVYLYQRDDKRWVAETNRGPVIYNSVGSTSSPYPEKGPEFENKINMTEPEYLPKAKYKLIDGEEKDSTLMTDPKIIGANNETPLEDQTSTTRALRIPDGANLIITSVIGGDIETQSPPDAYIWNKHDKFSGNKWNAGYTTQVHVTWRANYVEKKKIAMAGKSKIAINEVTNFTSTVATSEAKKAYGTPADVTTRSNVMWKSSNPGVATVSATGVVTGVAKGTSIISVDWKKDKYWLHTEKVVTVDIKTTGTPPTGSCVPTINPPSAAVSPVISFMNPNATGEILGDDVANGRHFDAVKAIPTSENLYSQAWGRNYLFQHTFANMKGTIDYRCTIDVTYSRTWKEKQPDIIDSDGKPVPQPDTEKSDTVTKTYSFNLTPRNYSYWEIKQLEVMGLNHAELQNYALPGGNVYMEPRDYTPPDVDTDNSSDVNDHVFPKSTGTISFTPPVLASTGYAPLDIPDHTAILKGMAEAQTMPPDVKNDRVTFNGLTIMSDNTVSSSGPTPTSIPAPTRIPDKMLFEDHQLISTDLENKADTPSTGTIYYEMLPNDVEGNGDKDFDIQNINTVTVHTPVVNYSLVSDDQAHNQKTHPNSNRSALILERPFFVRIPTIGQHLNEAIYPGYGNRDYAKYTRNKQVKFPFDVYNEDRTQYIYKDTWVDIPVTQEYTTFYMPVWVNEGNYDIQFRSIAENAPSPFEEQLNANTNLANHAAVETVPVEVIGRMYDFHVTDIADYLWETVFRTYPRTSTPSGYSYWVGLKGIDGDKRGNMYPFTLPIHPGSHPKPGYKNVAVKTGYHFKFDLKTKGNMFDVQDSVRITPSFYYMSEDGKTRTPIDIYYKAGEKSFVRIGSPEDTSQRYVILNDRLRNVPMEELSDTALYKYDHYFDFGQVGEISRDTFLQNYIDKASTKKTPVGGLKQLELPEAVRTLIGPKLNIPIGVDMQRANASIQKWYGEYSLPADIYGVAAGTNLAEYGRTHQGLTDRSPVFLKNGYFIVNFNLETIDQGNLKEPHLQYIHAPLMNQWKLEGFNNIVMDPYGNSYNLQDGDVVFYHTDKSSRDDFRSSVTH
ncbi:Ig-like domain-containing protein [Paenibacillus zeisoli]|uniref:Ig-like domain-containing protein n=2 Tax=Paenibacillus zeisoli TaxID=2496267 RepID=A0A3S1D8N2_9BACL|nr:Ig-like domain-containing protein [Paenibacillus zeisoli]